MAIEEGIIDDCIEAAKSAANNHVRNNKRVWAGFCCIVLKDDEPNPNRDVVRVVHYGEGLVEFGVVHRELNTARTRAIQGGAPPSGVRRLVKGDAARTYLGTISVFTIGGNASDVENDRLAQAAVDQALTHH